MATITIDPVTRIEGHLAMRVEVTDGKVTSAHAAGEMFRGFEVLLKGRHPLDAQQITQRICGVCPVSHGTASTFAQEAAYKLTPTKNGRLLRNLVLAANYLQSHILHFYHLSALDYIDVTAVLSYTGSDRVLQSLKTWIKGQVASKTLMPGAPLLPRYDAQYVKDKDLNCSAVRHYAEGLEMRALAHRMVAVLAGKIPHIPTLVPGGMTTEVTAERIAAYGSMLSKITRFIDDCYIPDVIAVAKEFPAYFKIGRWAGGYLSYGAFQQSDDVSDRFLPAGALTSGAYGAVDVARISEDVRYSMFSSGTGLAPERGETVAAPDKHGAYSWLKAPRYGGLPMEVGSLARILVTLKSGKRPAVDAAVKGFLAQAGVTAEQLPSVMGRHAVRALEAKLVAEQCAVWLSELAPGAPSCAAYALPEKGAGVGLMEAPRGALGHWIEIENKKIARYQCVVPTTWNCSPRDDRDVPGPVEQSLVGTPIADAANPIEAARVVRSYDPCIACAVH